MSATSSICNFDDAEEYHKDNHYIHTGYRKDYPDVQSITLSAFEVHNESFNFWSHFLGSLATLAFIAYSIVFFSSNKQQISETLTSNWQTFTTELDDLTHAYQELKHDFVSFLDDSQIKASEIIDHSAEIVSKAVAKTEEHFSQYKQFVKDAFQSKFK